LFEWLLLPKNDNIKKIEKEENNLNKEKGVSIVEEIKNTHTKKVKK